MGFKGYIISRLEVGQGWVAATFPNIIVDGQVAQVAVTSCCRWSAGGATRKDESAAETERGAVVQIVAEQVELVVLNVKQYKTPNCTSLRSGTILQHSATVRTVIHD